MRPLLVAPVVAFVLVAAGPSSARYNEAGAGQIASPPPSPRPSPGWSAPPGRAPWMGYPYRG